MREVSLCAFSGTYAHRRAQFFRVHKRQNILNKLYRLGALRQKAIERVRDESGDTSDRCADDCLASSHRF